MPSKYTKQENGFQQNGYHDNNGHHRVNGVQGKRDNQIEGRRRTNSGKNVLKNKNKVFNKWNIEITKENLVATHFLAMPYVAASYFSREFCSVS